MAEAVGWSRLPVRTSAAGPSPGDCDSPGIELLLKVIPADNILFGSEMVGAVRGIDPETGQYFDDTKRYLDSLPLSEDDRYKVFEGNARRVFPRLNARCADANTLDQ